MDQSQEPRNKSERIIRTLVGKLNDKATPQQEKDLIVLLHQMHVRLTLLEDEDPRRLSDTHF